MMKLAIKQQYFTNTVELLVHPLPYAYDRKPKDSIDTFVSNLIYFAKVGLDSGDAIQAVKHLAEE
jgi:hypothetical protein